MKKITLLLIFNSTFFILINSFAQTISGGANHCVSLCNDSVVKTWGFNLYGQLGNGTNTNSNVPVQVSALQSITAVAAGANHCLALKTRRQIGRVDEGAACRGGVSAEDVHLSA